MSDADYSTPAASAEQGAADAAIVASAAETASSSDALEDSGAAASASAAASATTSSGPSVDASADLPLSASSESAAALAAPAAPFLLRLRGLPWNTTRAEIVAFFATVRIAAASAADGDESVHLATDAHGSRQGEAFVRVESEADVAEALTYHRKQIGRRYIEVFRAAAGELAAMRARQQQSQEASAGADSLTGAAQAFVYIRGLPFAATDEEIVAFFAPLAVQAVHLLMTPAGRRSGEAYVAFAAPADAESAARDYNRRNMGARYIEVKVAAVEDARRKIGAAAPGGAFGGAAAASAGSSAAVLRMLGIPFSASDPDIVQFFKEANAKVIRIHRVPNGGDALIEFGGADDLARAMPRHKELLGSRYIQLVRISPEEFQISIARMYQQAGVPLQMRDRPQGSGYGDDRAAYGYGGGYGGGRDRMPPARAHYDEYSRGGGGDRDYQTAHQGGRSFQRDSYHHQRRDPSPERRYGERDRSYGYQERERERDHYPSAFASAAAAAVLSAELQQRQYAASVEQYARAVAFAAGVNGGVAGGVGGGYPPASDPSIAFAAQQAPAYSYGAPSYAPQPDASAAMYAADALARQRAMPVPAPVSAPPMSYAQPSYPAYGGGGAPAASAAPVAYGGGGYAISNAPAAFGAAAAGSGGYAQYQQPFDASAYRPMFADSHRR